jgi:hypothetical protein
MLLATALAWLLAAPQRAPDDDPVRVALYGRPEERAPSEVAESPAAYVGRAVRLRGRFEQGPDRGYRLCAQGTCLRLLPEEGLTAVLRANGALWLGRDMEVTGVLVRASASAPAEAAPAEAAPAVRFWRLAGAEPESTSLPGTPLTLESLVYAGGSRDGQLVRVRGQFRGRNLHGDLPQASQRGPADWVVKDDYYAVWVTRRGPGGRGWRLDPTSMDDTRTWVEISGRPRTRDGYVYLHAETVVPLSPPSAADAIAPPPAHASARTPPAVVFSLPLESEHLAPAGATLLIQFSTHMDPTSFARRVRLRYAGEEAVFDPARLTYDASRRTLVLEPGLLAAGRDLECLLLAGLIDVHGQALVPRRGAIVGGVVDVLRWRIASADAPSPRS